MFCLDWAVNLLTTNGFNRVFVCRWKQLPYLFRLVNIILIRVFHAIYLLDVILNLFESFLNPILFLLCLLINQLLYIFRYLQHQVFFAYFVSNYISFCYYWVCKTLSRFLRFRLDSLFLSIVVKPWIFSWISSTWIFILVNIRW